MSAPTDPLSPQDLDLDAELHSPADPELARVSRPVPLDTINKTGIERVRVLSHSMLEQRIRKLVEARLDEQSAATSTGALAELREKMKDRWETTETHRQARLENFEQRIQLLAETFDHLQESLERLEGHLEPETVVESASSIPDPGMAPTGVPAYELLGASTSLDAALPPETRPPVEVPESPLREFIDVLTHSSRTPPAVAPVLETHLEQERIEVIREVQVIPEVEETPPALETAPVLPESIEKIESTENIEKQEQSETIAENPSDAAPIHPDPEMKVEAAAEIDFPRLDTSTASPDESPVAAPSPASEEKAVPALPPFLEPHPRRVAPDTSTNRPAAAPAIPQLEPNPRTPGTDSRDADPERGLRTSFEEALGTRLPDYAASAPTPSVFREEPRRSPEPTTRPVYSFHSPDRSTLAPAPASPTSPAVPPVRPPMSPARSRSILGEVGLRSAHQLSSDLDQPPARPIHVVGCGRTTERKTDR